MWWIPLVAAVLSALCALIGNLCAERIRYPVTIVDAELRRLDDLIDAIRLIEMALHRGDKPSLSALQALTQQRHRLGINLTRSLGSNTRWVPIREGLASLSHYLSVVETAALDGKTSLLTDLDARDEALRLAIRQAAANHLVWQFLRPI